MKKSIIKTMTKWAQVLLFLSLATACLASPPNKAAPGPKKAAPKSAPHWPEWVSIIQLIANPEKYDGKLIIVVGFVHVEFEGDAVYLSEEDYKHRITKNGLGIGVADKNSGILLSKEKYGDRHCYIKGIFRAVPPRYLFLWSGSIDLKEIAPST